jgi:hypothetical protein
MGQAVRVADTFLLYSINLVTTTAAEDMTRVITMAMMIWRTFLM